MNDLLKNAITEFSELSESSMEKIIACWKKWELPKNQFLLKHEEVSDYIYFTEKGILRLFYVKDGKEVTEWIAMNGTFCLSITSFFERTPSHIAIHAIEPSIIWGIHHDDFMQLCNEYHDVERLMRKMLAASLILSQKRMYSLHFESAQQRYENLERENSSILLRVPLVYIASFLGITKESLSRIRAQR